MNIVDQNVVLTDRLEYSMQGWGDHDCRNLKSACRFWESFDTIGA